MIVAEGLEKRFGERVAVAGLSLDVRAGEVFGLLGPNGAGKTTTVRMLTALIAPTAGRATVAGCRIGEDDDGVRQRVGVLTETPGLYARLTAAENLRFFGKLHGVDDLEARIGRYLALLGLGDRKDDKAGSFSKGMRQKLAIARALLHEPQVVFLDEPTSGLDPTAARVVRDFVAELRADGRAIVLCTHNLDEAERLCDRIAIVQRTILRMGTPAELRRALAGARLVVTLRAPSAAAREAASALLGPASVSGDGPEIAVVTEDPEGIAPDVVRAVVLAGGEVVRVEAARPSLEAVYFDLVGADGAREGSGVNGARVRAVVEREVLDLRRNKMVLVSMLLLPLLMVAIVAASLLAVGGMLSGELAAKGFVPPPELAGVDLRAAVAVLINDQNMLYLILTPTLLPVVIGAYSIIGEKEAKSLEPLLATPLRTGELVLGKAVAALVPAVVIGLVQFALAIGTIALLSPPGVVEHALRPLWIVGIFGAMPLLAALSTLLAVVVSARVADVRTAQAIASLVILPVVATGVAVLVGQIYLTVGVMAVACAVLAALDVGVWWLAVRTFGRESILSRVG